MVEIGPVVLKREFLNIFNIILQFRFYLPFERGLALHLNKFESPLPKNDLCQNLVEICPVVLKKKIFNNFQYNFTFSLLSPLGKGRGPSFEQIWIPFIQGCFVPSLVEIGPVVLEKRIFLFWLMYFRYFVIICPWKRAGPFIWINLNPLYPRMLFAKFWLKLAQWFWRRRFFIFCQRIFAIL